MEDYTEEELKDINESVDKYKIKEKDRKIILDIITQRRKEIDKMLEGKKVSKEV